MVINPAVSEIIGGSDPSPKVLSSCQNSHMLSIVKPVNDRPTNIIVDHFFHWNPDDNIFKDFLKLKKRPEAKKLKIKRTNNEFKNMFRIMSYILSKILSIKSLCKRT